MENIHSNKLDVLPKLTEISAQTLGFINSPGFLNSIVKDHSNLEDLTMDVNTKCAHLQTHLNNLHRRLSTLLVSSLSQSIRAKSSLEDFIENLENLSFTSSYYGNRVERKQIEKMVDKDLAGFARELRRIDSIRQYAGLALKLEALVGDLEDAALSALNRHTGNTFSRIYHSSSISDDLYRNLENVQGAVKAINNIEDVQLDVMETHPQWHNLLKTVDARVDKIFSALRPQVIADHRNLLATLGWPPKLVNTKMQTGDAAASIPNPIVLMQGGKKESYSHSFLVLCALQHVHYRREERQQMLMGKKQEDVRLWAIDELVSPIALKIEHHLLKWKDQPELMFALVYKVTRDFIEGLDNVLQPLIDRARLLSCSAKEAWVSAMVQYLTGFLAGKIFQDLAVRYRDKSTRSDVRSSWLHLIDHIVRFDKQMQSLLGSETYLFLAETSPEITRSVSALFLFCDRPDWLHIWAKIELKDAWRKLKAELSDEEAWSAGLKLGNVGVLEKDSEQYCLFTAEDHKAPVVTKFVLKTTWELVQRCQTLPGNARRIQFIRSAPVKFLQQFLKVLLLRYSSAELPAHDAEEILVRVCQLVNAARFAEFKLQEWNDDADLMELKLAETGGNIDTKGNTASNSSFFDKEIQSLVEMETNWLMEIITHILCQFENSSFYYFQNAEQFELPHSDLNQVTEREKFISDDLVVALDNLRIQLLLIKEHLNANDFLDAWRSIAEGLDHFTFRSIQSTTVRFSEEGTKQFVADMNGLFLVFKSLCARPEAFFPCIRDLLKLIRLSKEEVVSFKSNLLDSAKCSDCLLSHSISSLSVHQALKVLNNRTFFD